MKKFLIASFLCINIYTLAFAAGDTLRVRLTAEPSSLNPVNIKDATSIQIVQYLFQSLQEVNPESGVLVPLLCTANPVVQFLDNGRMKFTYEIRKDAKWANNTAIMGSDVVFSFKTILCPLVDDETYKSFYEAIEDVTVAADNPRKVEVTCSRYYILNEDNIGRAFIIPEYLFDPKGMLKKFTVKQFMSKGKALEKDKRIVAFALKFNTFDFLNEGNDYSGSGPYELIDWDRNWSLLLKKKANWWGSSLSNESIFFVANPSFIQFRIIADNQIAVQYMKNGHLDVLLNVTTTDFTELKSDNTLTGKFNFLAPSMGSYTYIALNMRNRLLSDERVRKALAMITDYTRILNEGAGGYGFLIHGPFIGCVASLSDNTIVPYRHDLTVAKQLLAEAGWSADENNNGILDKRIDGELYELTMNFNVNAGSPQREKIALMLKDDAAKLGIEINIVQKEWAVFMEDLMQHNFDLAIGAWLGVSSRPDPKQIWHTSSYNEGSNYTGFGSEQTDKLIDDIRAEPDKEKRTEMFRELDLHIHQQVPYIFLYEMTNRVITNMRYGNIQTYTCLKNIWLGEAELLK